MLASAIGITAMLVGPRAKIRPGRNIHTATAVHRMANPAAEANATRRRLKSKNRFAGSRLVATATVVSGEAGPGWLTGAISGAAGAATSVTPASVTWTSVTSAWNR